MVEGGTGSAARLCLGVITGARGVTGDVRILSHTEVPADIARYGPLQDQTGDRQFDLRITGAAKGQLIGRIKGVSDRDAAEALKGTELFVDREALPSLAESDTWYQADLIGMAVETVDGTAVGMVTGVVDYGAGNVLEIARPGMSDPALAPFTKAVVPVVDSAARRIVIDPPSGLLDMAGGEDGEQDEGQEKEDG